MTDSEFAFGSQFDDVAAIDFHHPAQFRDKDFQERIQINRSRQIRRQTPDDGLTRFMQLQLTFKRKTLLCFDCRLHLMRINCE